MQTKKKDDLMHTTLIMYPSIILLTRSNFGLVTHDAYSASVHAGEPHHNVFGVAGHDLKEVPLIHYLKRCMQKCLPLAEVK